jgi:hypothetical protein
MATLQSLHDLVTANETQQGSSDRITGSEVRAVDNAIIDELSLRGAVKVPEGADLATILLSESKTAYVTDAGTTDDGVYVITQFVGQPVDFVNIFPSSDAGFVWKRIGNFYEPNVIKSFFQANNGITFDAATGIISLGQTWNIAIDPSSQLQEHREVNLNNFAFFFVQSHTPAQRVNFGAGNMIQVQNDSTDVSQYDVQNINSNAAMRLQAGQTLSPWSHSFRQSYFLNGNAIVYSAENVHSQTWIQSEFSNDTGYPGGTIACAPLSYNNLMTEIGITAGFAGGWTGIMANLSTRAKLSGTGGIAGDKFYHINVNTELLTRSSTILNEHVGIFINPLKLVDGVATNPVAIWQTGVDDKNIFAGITILSTPQTPATSADPGDTGTIRWDENFIYVKTASGGWKRAAIATF